MGQSAELDEPAKRRGLNLKGLIAFPVSLFPFLALATYDWRSVGFLQTPPAPSANWIGVLGDAFAYWGYAVFGLAIWIVPAFCLASGLRALAGGGLSRKGRTGRLLWRLAMMASAASILQAMQGRAPGLDALLDRLNLMAAGGAAGYMFMEKGLASLLSGVGASVVATIALLVSTAGAIGADAIAAAARGTWRWVAGGKREKNAGDDGEEAAIAALKAAKEEARRQREEEKRLAKERKLEEKREREALKEAAWREAQTEAVAPETQSATEKAAVAEPPAATAEEPAARPVRRTPGQDDPAQAGGPAETPPEQPKKPYVLPPIDLLNPPNTSKAEHGDTEKTGEKLVNVLKLFGVNATIKYCVEGPVVTKYAIFPEPGTRYNAVTSLADNIKGELCAKSIRIEAPIPGENCIGVEVPNPKPAGVTFREVMESDEWRNSKAEVPLLFGKDVAGKALVADLATMPHLLVAGATGQGKSVCLNSIINGLLMSRTPDELKLIMVDPKSVEFTQYANIPHLLTPVITDNRKVLFTLNWVAVEMEKRLKLFQRNRVRNIVDYNKRKRETQGELFGGGGEAADGDPKMVPYIVVIIDELADLMMTNGKEVTPNIARIAAKARAAGIHLILATQRPDTKVINGTIKSNIPGRVAFKTSQAIDSRTILDAPGAEGLIGRGDMLFKGKNENLVRAQGAWISDGEIDRITAFIGERCGTEFDEHLTTKLSRVKEAEVEDPFAANEDDIDNQEAAAAAAAAPSLKRQAAKASNEEEEIRQAIECIINTHRASTSHFQRILGWGYNHATRILDKLAERGVVTQLAGMGARQILMDHDQLAAMLAGGGAEPGEEAAQDGGGADGTEDNGFAETAEETQEGETA